MPTRPDAIQLPQFLTRLAALLALAATVVSTAQAGKVSAWRQRGEETFSKAELEGVVVADSGSVTLGREVETLADLSAALAWDVVRTADGQIYAATAMPGQVVKFVGKDKTETLWKDEQQQGLSLAAYENGDLVLGTGPEGALYKVSGGETSQLAKLDCMYIWDVLVVGDTAYAATGPGGKIFKVAADGSSSVFYSSGQEHVLALAAGGDGTILAGTDGEGLVLSIDPKGTARVIYDTPDDEVRTIVVDGSTTFVGTAKAGEMGSSDKVKNHVYRIDAEGGVLPLIEVPHLVYAIAREGDTVFAGTGTKGLLYGVSTSAGDARQVAALDTELLLATCRDKEDRILFTTGNPAKLVAVSKNPLREGTLTSEVLDAEMISHFGTMDWTAKLPAGAQISIATRSGNTEKVDDTWTEWTNQQSSPETAKVESPSARFLQYRVTLRAGKSGSPELRGVSIMYQTANLKPSITKFEVPHVEEADGSKVLDKLKFEWEGKDPNDDKLAYTLKFRKPQWSSWITLKDGLDKDEYEWDIASVPEGTYVMQLEASDRPSNPESKALAAVEISEPFAVDRLPPQVSLKLGGVDKDGASLQLNAVDTIGPLLSAEYSIDSQDWVSIFPDDLLFDSREENFEINLGELKPGTHVIVVRVKDAAGHVGSTDLVIEARK